MRYWILLFLCSAFISLSAQEKPQRAQMALPNITLSPNKPFAIPIQEANPFLSYSLKWEGEAHSFLIRFSIDGEIWQDWINVEIDPHSNMESQENISQLQFTSKKHKFFQIAPVDHIAVQNLIIHFYSPGETGPVKSKDMVDLRSDDCSCPLPSYQNRNDWCPTGDCPQQSNPTINDVTHLVIHHSAGSNDVTDWPAVVRSIWNFHVNVNSWSDIGYNWLIGGNGVIYQGRGNDVRGAHFCGQNGGTMGVCLMGNFTDVAPTDLAKSSLVDLLAWKSCESDIDPSGVSNHPASGLFLKNILGHREGCSTSCPGNAFFPQVSGIRNQVTDLLDDGCVIGVQAASDLRANLTQNSTAAVSWIDNSDNEDGFLLERSINDSLNFNLLVTLGENFTFYEDTNLEAENTYFYRIRSFNDTDTSDFSNIASMDVVSGIDPFFNNNTVNLFPNPVQQQFYLELDNQWEGQLTIEIRNIHGSILQSYNINKRQKFYRQPMVTQDWPSGTYILNIKYAEGLGSFKFLKN